MQTAVVTGGDGFIGKHLCAALSQQFTVISLDQRTGNDIRYCNLPEADIVFHLAAQTNAQSDDAMEDASVNIGGTIRILERYGPKVVFASSCAVHYPWSPYAISKLTGELYAQSFGALIVRLCNITGDGGHSVVERFKNEDTITIHGDGNQLRSYAPVETAVAAFMDAAISHEHRVVMGVEATVNQIADAYPNKPRQYQPRSPFDLLDGRQKETTDLFPVPESEVIPEGEGELP